MKSVESVFQAALSGEKSGIRESDAPNAEDSAHAQRRTAVSFATRFKLGNRGVLL
jgi:hypothetical protein